MTDDFGLSDEQRELILKILYTAQKSIEQVAVFGSRAQGKHRPNSDLDLVLYGSADEVVCDRLWTLFHESLLPFAVDVVSYSTITYAPLRTHIDAVARPLFIHTEQGLVVYDKSTMRLSHPLRLPCRNCSLLEE
ncbi:MAG: nucleotidyltransferase domain-containing protein [Candidatus Electrothrix scaldis]|nr:MAG: nucleotidyltransferase domain-containing protein [Candidatus Electrothrix sp. GW3-3]